MQNKPDIAVYTKMVLEEIEKPSFFDDFVVRVKRTWKERFFTLPWRPLHKYKTVEKEPLDKVIKII